MAQDKNKSKEYIQYWAEGCSLSPCVASNIATVLSVTILMTYMHGMQIPMKKTITNIEIQRLLIWL